ncbi:MAG: phosphoribosylamine--glycine ligase [Ignavibacteria bacterium]
MKILIVGNGGREHAIAWKISNSSSFKELNCSLYCTQGNPGIDKLAIPVNINSVDIKGITQFVNNDNIDLVVIGPEIPLSLGLADSLYKMTNAKVFGPSKIAAEIETSKVYAKDFMLRYGIPTASYKSFDKNNYSEVESYLDNITFPAVLKADGLAGGKGVYISVDKSDAVKFIKDIHTAKIFGDSGEDFIIEEFLSGFELSVFVITDGKDYIVLPFAQDHKKIGEGDTGKNTGGMGAYSPADKLIKDSIFNKIKNKIIEPALVGLDKDGRTFKGCLYCGLMIVNNNPYVIEFNCRFGDPETQAVLPLIKSDFLEMIISVPDNKIKNYKLEKYEKFSACVVIASKGYPDNFEKGKEIHGLDNFESDALVFHSGTKIEDGKIKSNGGRVMSIVCLSDISIDDALSKSYKNIKNVSFDNIYYRKDIGRKFSELMKNKI